MATDKEKIIIEQALAGASVFSLDISEETYNDTDDLNPFWRSGQMKVALKSDMAHFARSVWYEMDVKEKNERLGIEPESKAHFIAGHMIEDWARDTGRMDKYFVLNPDHRPDLSKGFTVKENKDWKKKVLDSASDEGKVIVDHNQVELFDYLRPSELEQILLDKIRDEGTDEQCTCLWTDPETGLLLRSRSDFTRPATRTIIDCKSTKAETKEAAIYEIKKLNMPQQALQQIEGARQTGYMPGGEPINYFWLFFSKAAPFNVFAIQYSQESQERDFEPVYRKSVTRASILETYEYGFVPSEDEFLTY